MRATRRKRAKPKNPRKKENVIIFNKRAAPVAPKAGKNNKCTCFASRQ
jgi:hypothetical protein